ncbi:hypothetical protein [uncultured Clostridium sp.]|uniref:hypothetical protein n=1 Tax=uncultured Clostridium sp. TaxID=59620 RepID=UPI0025F062C4|nr:hypothetical protein [uncultured Clostridium sp.]
MSSIIYLFPKLGVTVQRAAGPGVCCGRPHGNAANADKRTDRDGVMRTFKERQTAAPSVPQHMGFSEFCLSIRF